MSTRSVLRASRPSSGSRRPAATSTRRCARPGCAQEARATLTFSYDNRTAVVAGLQEQPDPAAYDLCGACADRMTPPRGWQLADERPPVAPTLLPTAFDERDAVAVLANALHGDATRGDNGRLEDGGLAAGDRDARILAFPGADGTAMDATAMDATDRDATDRAATAFEDSAFGDAAFEDPAFEDPAFEAPAFEAPAPEDPAADHAAHRDLASDEPAPVELVLGELPPADDERALVLDELARLRAQAELAAEVDRSATHDLVEGDPDPFRPSAPAVPSVGREPAIEAPSDAVEVARPRSARRSTAGRGPTAGETEPGRLVAAPLPGFEDLVVPRDVLAVRNRT